MQLLREIEQEQAKRNRELMNQLVPEYTAQQVFLSMDNWRAWHCNNQIDLMCYVNHNDDILVVAG